MTLHDQIAQDEARLRAHGYDGLVIAIGSEVCGCGIDDLRPCGEIGTGCRPARKGEDGLFYPARKAVCRMSRGGNGRRLTYRERWERMREWLLLSLGAEHNLGARDMAQDTLVRMDQMDRTTLVKARPVRKRKGRTR